jgi:hypothetical protein
MTDLGDYAKGEQIFVVLSEKGDLPPDQQAVALAEYAVLLAKTNRFPQGVAALNRALQMIQDHPRIHAVELWFRERMPR